MWNEDEDYFHRISDSEYDRQEAVLGAGWLFEDGVEPKPWLLTSRDQWVANPYYSGPAVPHPEDYEDDEMEGSELFDDAELDHDAHVQAWYDHMQNYRDPDCPF